MKTTNYYFALITLLLSVLLFCNYGEADETPFADVFTSGDMTDVTLWDASGYLTYLDDNCDQNREDLLEILKFNAFNIQCDDSGRVEQYHMDDQNQKLYNGYLLIKEQVQSMIKREVDTATDIYSIPLNSYFDKEEVIWALETAIYYLEDERDIVKKIVFITLPIEKQLQANGMDGVAYINTKIDRMKDLLARLKQN